MVTSETEIHGKVLANVQKIFSKVLEQPVLPDDDFFDLGGDSLMAENLVMAINKKFKAVYNVSNIADYPTPAKFAESLTRGMVPGDLIMPLPSSSGPEPLLFVHGAYGGNYQLRLIGDELKSQWKIAGVRARGYIKDEEPHVSLSELVQDYLATAKDWFGKYPNVIAGNCAGGMIALQLAREIFDKPGARMTVIIIDPPGTFLKYHQGGEDTRTNWGMLISRQFQRFVLKTLTLLGLGNTKEANRSRRNLLFHRLISFVREIYPEPFPCNMLVFVGNGLMDVSVPGIQAWADDQVLLRFLPLPGFHENFHETNHDVIDAEIISFVNEVSAEKLTA